MSRRAVGEAVAWLTCACLAGLAGAKASEPVETKGWSGAKEALQQAALPPPPPPAGLFVCYMPVTVETEEGPVAALALFLGRREDEYAIWPIEHAIGLTVAGALTALGDSSTLADLSPDDVTACPADALMAPTNPGAAP